MHQLVIASNNPGKLRELKALLQPAGYDLITQGELKVPECAEPHHTFIENALAKARHATQLTGLPAIADDSGICVQALLGAPGVHSARYAGEPLSDARNNEKLLANLSHLSLPSQRRAHYICLLVYVRHADDPEPIIADGCWHGRILLQPRGDGGFGYDPLFWLPRLKKSAAELSASEKNQISHRAMALRQLAVRLQRS